MPEQRKNLTDINGGKKRKVFRNGTKNGTTTTTTTTTTMSTTTTTTTTKNPETPNRTRLTPEAAASYIQQATEAIAASTSALAAASRSVNAENVKITLGPPLDGNKLNNSSSTISFGNLDLAALKAGDLSYFTAAAATRNAKRSGNTAGASSNSSNRKNEKDGLPCSEAEMKALMSMFVEIMGMSMDTEKLGKTSKKKNLGLLDPGWKWPADGMIPKEWDVIPASYDEGDDDDEDDSLPDLDEVNELCRNQAQKMASTLTSDTKNLSNVQTTSGSSGIAPVEWESLEQVAIEDAMEAEERARKAAKRREKKNRKKEKARKEAAARAAEAVHKKREKAILSWRSRVVSAVQSNEVTRVEALVAESPLRQKEEDEIITPHLEFLLPNIVAKNRQQAERGKEARTVLAKYIFQASLPVVFTPLRTGRSALHTACFFGEIEFVRQVVDGASQKESVVPPSFLNTTCQDSGWSPLHYAVVSGSDDVMETLLAGGCDVKTRTNDTHTWRSNNGKGITARELAESVIAGNHDKIFETHGIALQEVAGHFLSHTEEKRKFLKLLDRNVERLKDIERNGYTPRKNEMPKEEEEADMKRINSTVSDSSIRKKKKKKKKQQQQQQQQATEAITPKVANPTADVVSISENDKDPLVSLLLGMGFTEKQIKAAAKACGGTNRATADDLIAWIFAEESGEHESDDRSQQNQSVVDTMPTVKEEKLHPNVEDERVKEAKRLEEAVKREEEARIVAQRLAAKREETRRRNREWNNRTQVRQREEEQAKLEEIRARTVASTQTRTQSSSIPTAGASFFPVGQGAVPQAPNLSASTSSYAQVKLQSQMAGMNSAVDLGQFNNGAAARRGGTKIETPIILSRNDNIGGNPQILQKMKQNQTASSAAAQVYQYDQPSQGYPPILDAASQQFHQVNNDVIPGQGYQSMASDAVASQGFLPLTSMGPQGFSSQNFPQMGEMTSPGFGQIVADGAPQTYSQMGATDDTSTVSSLGSGMGKVGTTANVNSSIPPGFRSAPATLETQTEEYYSYHVNENPMGEMRATAQEFVPISFAQSQPQVQSHVQSAPATSGTTSNVSAHFNPSASTSSDQVVISRLRSFSESGASSLLMAPGQHITSYDRLAAMNPSSDQSGLPPSAASSVTGVSTLAEDNFIAAPAAANVLETISAAGSFDGGAGSGINASTASSAAIWGNLNSGNVNAANLTSTSSSSTINPSGIVPNATALSGLVGLPSFSQNNTGGQLDQSSGPIAGSLLSQQLDGMAGQTTRETSDIGAGWGSSMMGGGNTGGSIW